MDSDMQNRFYNHDSEVNSEAIWEHVSSHKKRRRRSLIIWFLTGTSMLCLGFYYLTLLHSPISEQKHLTVNNTEKASNNAAFEKSPATTSATTVQSKKNQDEIINLTETNRSESTKQIIDTRKTLPTSNNTFTPSESNSSFSFSDSHERNIANNFLTQEPVGHDQKIKARNDIGLFSLYTISSITPKYLDTQIDLPIPSFATEPIDIPSQKYTPLHIGLQYSIGSYIRLLNLNILPDQNINKTESPFLNQEVGLSIKKNLTRHWYVGLGVNYSWLQGRFIHQYSETVIEPTETIVEILVSAEGTENIIETVDQEYILNYSKDILNKYTYFSMDFMTGYNQYLSEKSLISFGFSYRMISPLKTSGLILLGDEIPADLSSYPVSFSHQLGLNISLNHTLSDALLLGISLNQYRSLNKEADEHIFRAHNFNIGLSLGLLIQ